MDFLKPSEHFCSEASCGPVRLRSSEIRTCIYTVDMYYLYNA